MTDFQVTISLILRERAAESFSAPTDPNPSPYCRTKDQTNFVPWAKDSRPDGPLHRAGRIYRLQ